MRILFLTQIFPYPPDAGPKVKTWNVLRYLIEKGHQVILASYIRPGEETYVPYLRKVCSEVFTVPIRRSRAADGLYWFRSLVTGRPFLIERDDQVAMRQSVQKIMRSYSIDCLHADQLSMVQFTQPFGRPSPDSDGKALGRRESDRLDGKIQTELSPVNPSIADGRRAPLRVFDAHNAVWTIMDRMSESLPWYWKPLLKLEARRVKLFEGMAVDLLDHTLAVTEIDRGDLNEARRYYLQSIRQAVSQDGGPAGRSAPISVIPIAVDTEKLQPIGRQRGSRHIFTLGTMIYPPNVDGLRWFVREVLPIIRKQVPEVQLTIAGKNPPHDLQQLAQDSHGAISVPGYLQDIRPALEKSSLMVVPVRAGSGMRVRILEAFAYGMPVVTTTVGLEGIQARSGEDVLVADTPADFANAVIALLLDENLQTQLAENGRRIAVQRYDWKVALRQMDHIYGNLESQTNA